jgi:putative ABC transport system permease protein
MKPRTAPIPWALLRWFLSAAWQLQRGRWLLAAGAVAVGIALATAVHTVNRSALDEFRRAIDSINGESTHALVAKRQEMDERLFDKVLEEAHGLGILAASPVLSISAVPHEARATDAVRESAPETAITVLGIDIFNAAQVTPLSCCACVGR